MSAQRWTGVENVCVRWPQAGLAETWCWTIETTGYPKHVLTSMGQDVHGAQKLTRGWGVRFLLCATMAVVRAKWAWSRMSPAVGQVVQGRQEGARLGCPQQLGKWPRAPRGRGVGVSSAVGQVAMCVKKARDGVIWASGACCWKGALFGVSPTGQEVHVAPSGRGVGESSIVCRCPPKGWMLGCARLRSCRMGKVCWGGIGGRVPTFLHADLTFAGEPVVSAQPQKKESKHGEHERMWSHQHATCMGA